ncbi:P-loop containing nucleoside triphosphate hydrolase protein [Tothia fuscella]|uniref:RNA helicase n=1 Tax=Tothia fuscella TaxID=1048955 RepID=A0A9P4NKP0_9PEZI|nr:P-loop containing nucleoside triphosphate hydrolase protein [Tothia fuscella]
MELKTWVSDSLTKFAGGSDPTIVDFVLATASTSKSSSQLQDKLSSYLEGSDVDIKKFANELFDRSGGSKHSTTGKSASPKVEKKQRYALLPMEQASDVSLAPQPRRDKDDRDKRRKDGRREKDRHKDRRLRERPEDFEDRWGDQSEEEEVEEEFEDPKARKRRRIDPDVESRGSASDSDRERDRRELKELDEKLRQKNGTKKHTGSLEPPKVNFDDVRLKSRQDYLRKREIERVALLAKQVEEEEREEAQNPDLTIKELEEFAANRNLLKLARDRLQARDNAEDRDGFYMDADNITKTETLNKRIKEREGVHDLQLWEEEQTKRAKATAGLRTERVQEGDYEYVFDEASKVSFLDGGGIPASQQTKELQAFKEQLEAAISAETSLQEGRKKLPLYAMREEMVQAMRDYQILIVSSETGSGKTTQIPQYILEENLAGGLTIACTQPRRVAAMSVAARVAEERGARLGGEVGYSVRFENKTTPGVTKIKFLTDGMLLRELQDDPTLSQYGAVMLDEAHERTISTDVLGVLLKDLARARGLETEQPLRIIISSATMNADKFSQYYDGAPLFFVPGRTFAVNTLFTQNPEANYLQAAITTVMQTHISQPLPGDILVFLTGQQDIDEACEELEATCKKLGNRVAPLIICPIYATLPSEVQAKIFEPTPKGCRKVVVSTNIAETSLTIDGIVFVVDCGLEKSNSVSNGISSLQTQPISRASAVQRAGRAGRVRDGICMRLYTEYAYSHELEEEPIPEIQRSNVESLVLQLKSLGVDNLLDFDFIDAPSAESLMGALESLYLLGALNSQGEVTRLGRKIVEVPSSPQLAAALIASANFGCTQEVLTIVSMLEESASLFYRPKDQKVHADSARQRFTHKEGGDHLTLMQVYNTWVEADYSITWCKENFVQYRSLQRARLVREQLEALCERIEIPPETTCGAGDYDKILKALLSGFFANTATLTRDGRHYRTLSGKIQTRIHPSSVLAANDQAYLPKLVMYSELRVTSEEWMSNVAPIEASWIGEVAPHFWKKAKGDGVEERKKLPKGQGRAA